jgi:hypothetical protein
MLTGNACKANDLGVDWFGNVKDNGADPLCLQPFIEPFSESIQYQLKTGADESYITPIIFTDASALDYCMKYSAANDLATCEHAYAVKFRWTLSLAEQLQVPRLICNADDTKCVAFVASATGGTGYDTRAGGNQTPTTTPTTTPTPPVIPTATTAPLIAHRTASTTTTAAPQPPAPALTSSEASGNQIPEQNGGGQTPKKLTPRQQYLAEMYEQSVTYCLAARNKQHFWFRFGMSSYSFGDILLAAAVPVASFENTSKDTIALISGLVTLFGAQFKSAIQDTSPTDDFSQTQAAMFGFYSFISADDAWVQSTSSDADWLEADGTVYRIFKATMEQACFSQLTLPGGSANSPAKAQNGNQDPTAAPKVAN